jgi:chemotaxis response regulator CheB
VVFHAAPRAAVDLDHCRASRLGYPEILRGGRQRAKVKANLRKNGLSEAKSGRRSRSGGHRLAAEAAAEGSEDFPVVGIGASAGGLEACTKLLGALPSDNGMAFILVQHLDPKHESMMVELLAHRTAMTVVQATNGAQIERKHLYIIPPDSYLSVSNGALHLSQPLARHGARLPFDFLLRSLAEEYGERAIGVILSGTGADGSLGVKAVKEKGGLVIAQDPDEAAFDGMPRNAILTDAVDQISPANDAYACGCFSRPERRLSGLAARDRRPPSKKKGS